MSCAVEIQLSIVKGSQSKINGDKTGTGTYLIVVHLFKAKVRFIALDSWLSVLCGEINGSECN
jgi:hypothetical protein